MSAITSSKSLICGISFKLWKSEGKLSGATSFYRFSRIVKSLYRCSILIGVRSNSKSVLMYSGRAILIRTSRALVETTLTLVSTSIILIRSSKNTSQYFKNISSCAKVSNIFGLTLAGIDSSENKLKPNVSSSTAAGVLTTTFYLSSKSSITSWPSSHFSKSATLVTS